MRGWLVALLVGVSLLVLVCGVAAVLAVNAKRVENDKPIEQEEKEEVTYSHIVEAIYAPEPKRKDGP